MHYVSNQSVDIGRNSSTSQVHFSVGKNSFVSRKHLRIMPNDGEFELICLGKNGVFVDDVFQRKTDEPLKLAKMYVTMWISGCVRRTNRISNRFLAAPRFGFPAQIFEFFSKWIVKMT